MRLPPEYIYSKYHPFYHWVKAYHLWNVFPALAPVCLTVLFYNAFSGPEPGWPSYQGQFFFIPPLTRCDVSGSCGGRKLYSEALLNSSIGFGVGTQELPGNIITSLAFAIMHTQ